MRHGQNELRLAVGRENWLFVGSDDGGEVNAAFTSLLASCQMHGVEPRSYLRDVLCLLPQWPELEMLALSPLCWAATSSRGDVRSRLDANHFRALTLPDRG